MSTSLIAAPDRDTAPERHVPRLTPADAVPKMWYPTQLPPRADGQHLHQLSQTSIDQLLRCPEQFRLERINQIRKPKAGVMVLGSAVEAGINYMLQARIDGRLHEVSIHDCLDKYHTVWAEEESYGVDYSERPRGELIDIGARLVAYYLHKDGMAATFEPAALQIKQQFTLADGLKWTVVGYLDILATDGRVIDLKAKNRIIEPYKADRNFQATLYLAFRAWQGTPAPRFEFHTLNTTASQPAGGITPTTRTPRQLNAVGIRVAQAARTLDALYQRFGPDEPWTYAEADHWVVGYASFRRRARARPPKTAGTS